MKYRKKFSQVIVQRGSTEQDSMTDVERLESVEKESSRTTLQPLTFVNHEHVPSSNLSEHIDVLFDGLVGSKNNIYRTHISSISSSKSSYCFLGNVLTSLEVASGVEKLVILDDLSRLCISLNQRMVSEN